MTNAARGYALFPGRAIALFPFGWNPRRYLDAMLTPPDLAPERPPCVVSEDVFPRENLIFRDSLLHESLEDRAVVHGRLVANRPSKRLLLHLFSVNRCWHGRNTPEKWVE